MDTCEVEFAQPGRWRGAAGIRLVVKGTSSATVNVEAWENPRLTGQDPPGELWEIYLALPSSWREVMLPFTSFVPNQYFRSDPANLNGILEPEEVVALNFTLGKFLAGGGQFCLCGGSLVMRRRPQAPSVDDPPSGPASVPLGEDGRWSAVPESAEKLMVRCAFDWGDGATSETTHVYSGETAGMAHRWTVPGRYKVRAKAVDIEGRSSALSAATEVEVTPADVLLESFDDLGRVYEWANPGCTVAKSSVPGVHGSAVRFACTIGKSSPRPTAGFSTDVNVAGGNWSSFSGLRIQARTERGEIIYLKIHEKGKGSDAKGGEIWEVPLKPGPEWTSFFVPFSEFKLAMEDEPPAEDPNGRLDLARIAGVAMHFGRNRNFNGCSDVAYIDDLVLVVKGVSGKAAGR